MYINYKNNNFNKRKIDLDQNPVLHAHEIARIHTDLDDSKPFSWVADAAYINNDGFFIYRYVDFNEIQGRMHIHNGNWQVYEHPKNNKKKPVKFMHGADLRGFVWKNHVWVYTQIFNPRPNIDVLLYNLNTKTGYKIIHPRSIRVGKNYTPIVWKIVSHVLA